MPTVQKVITYRCKLCRLPVEMHYDHVGSCDGECSGTFDHPRRPSVVCVNAGKTIGHAQVVL